MDAREDAFECDCGFVLHKITAEQWARHPVRPLFDLMMESFPKELFEKPTDYSIVRIFEEE